MASSKESIQRTKHLRENGCQLDINVELKKALQCYQTGQLRKAEELCHRILRTSPNDACLLHLLGLIANQAGDTEKALTLISRAIENDSENPIYHNNLGIVFQNQGELDRAISCFQIAVLLKKDFAEAHYNMGNALQDQGKLDEAISCFHQAVNSNSDFVAAYYNMGVVFQNQGKLDDAISCFCKAVQLQPEYARAYHNMAKAFKEQGKLDEALTAFQSVAELDPANHEAKHQIAALTGQKTRTAPKEYVRGLFDQYASSFDDHLVEILQYETPTLLRHCLEGLLGDDMRFRNVIDLGCGTGLGGMAFRDISDCLTGIDISAKMVEEARRKAIYDILTVEDMIEFLRKTDEKYDLFISSDVLVYVGDLKPLFASIRKCSLHGAYFVFSSENCRGKSYILRETGRYAHSPSYIESLARERHFGTQVRELTCLRKEGGRRVMGNLYALRYTQ